MSGWRNATVVVAMTVAFFTLAACGGGGGEPGTPEQPGGGLKQPATEDGLKDAAAETWALIVEGDNRNAYRQYSAACRESMTYSEFVGLMAFAHGIYESFYDIKLSDTRVREVQVRNFTPESAEARVLIEAESDPDLELNSEDEWETWVYEGDGWRATDCETEGFTASED